MPTKAFVVTIGDELTKGEILNSNASHIADLLSARGVGVEALVTLPDDWRTSARLVRRFMKDKGVYVFTGGLGGTRDDVTRRILGRVLRRRFVVDEARAESLRGWYREKKRRFFKSDLMQASYPEGGGLLDNPVGIAYGFHVSDEGREIFALPGVPREMEAMLDGGVLPKLEREGLFTGRRREILTFSGVAEYTLDREVSKIVAGFEGIRYGTRSGYDSVRVVVETEGEGLDACVRELERRLSRHFVARGGRGLEEAVGEALSGKRLTLSTAESCTAGFLSKVITDVPGSSAYYLGGVVAYGNAAKARLLGVQKGTIESHGAVSARTAEEMAVGALERFSSDIAAAVTGVAGPGGGSDEKPVGTVFICVRGAAGKPTVERNVFLGDRESVRRRSVNRALFMILRHAQGVETE